MVEATQIEEILRKTLLPVHLEIEDLSDGCGSKYRLLIVSVEFSEKSLLQRHRMVNEALVPFMDSIHAVTMQTFTPEQWKERKKL